MLYLIRHAHAVDAEEDPSRPLSERGREQVKALARFLKPTGCYKPQDVWHSSLVRSRETATLLSRHLGLIAKHLELPDMEPEDDPHAIFRRIKLVQRSLAIVGHEPHLSALASLLVAGRAEPPAFVFKKCAALALEPHASGWLVRWQVAPELLA